MKLRSAIWERRRRIAGERRRRITAYRYRLHLLKQLFSAIGKETVIQAPRVLSFRKNSTPTVDFLAQVRAAALRSRDGSTRLGLPDPRVYVDLTKIERLSVPVAVVLSAEFQRWSIVTGVRLRPRRIKEWAPEVRSLLTRLGTFELLGVRSGIVRTRRQAHEIVVLPLQSGVLSEQEKVAALQDDLHTLGVLFDCQPFIFDGLSEAVLNAIDHAYTARDGDLARIAKGGAGHRWWATSCYDPVTENLRFFVYDQGVGIRRTLDQKAEWRPLIDGLLSKVGLERTDAQVIEAAFEIGRTRTGLAERGKGLDQMASVARQVANGYLRVISGRGDVETDGHGTYKCRSLSAEAGGTLIEWSLPYAELRRESSGEDGD